MKMLSLTQPWAQLVVEGHKGLETRSWRTAYRGWLGIHASKGFPRDCRELVEQEPFLTALNRPAESLDLGAVIGVVKLTGCLSTDSMFFSPPTEPELSFGDFSMDRYAWELTEPGRLNIPIGCRGALGLWSPSRVLEDSIWEDLSHE